MTIKVLVNGAKGKMGTTLSQALKDTDGFEICGQSNSTSELENLLKLEPDIAVDLTTPNSVYDNAKIIIGANVRPVIGTSGLNIEQIEELQALCINKGIGGIIAPNFSIGAMLMIKCASLLANSFEKAEIIELHHDKKLDKPSGTAKQTAQIIQQTRNNSKNPLTNENFTAQSEPPIHSIRLPGLLAHQKVIFGSLGESLTISHDSISRECFVPGMLFACKKAMTCQELIYGLEKFL